MALTATVEKHSVSLRMPKCWNITFQLTLREDADVVLRRSFSVVYKLGQNVTDVATGVLTRMQATIDQYAAEDALFNNATLDQVVTALNSELEVK